MSPDLYSADVIFTAEGKLRQEYFREKLTNEVSFRVCVSNEVWSIDGTSSQGGEGKFIQVFDGAQRSSATHFPGNLVSLTDMGNDATLRVDNTDTPDCLPPIGGGAIWLAYASSSKFSNRKSGLQEPTWFINLLFRDGRFSTPAVWERLEEPPFLPVSVSYFFDEARFKSFAAGEVASSQNYVQPGGLVKWANYQVVAVTNISGLLLPRVFELTVYAVRTGATESLVYKFSG